MDVQDILLGWGWIKLHQVWGEHGRLSLQPTRYRHVSSFQDEGAPNAAQRSHVAIWITY